MKLHFGLKQQVLFCRVCLPGAMVSSNGLAEGQGNGKGQCGSMQSNAKGQREGNMWTLGQPQISVPWLPPLPPPLPVPKPPKPAPWEVAPALNPLQLAAIVDEYKDRERCARFLTTQPTVNNTVSLEQIQPVIWLLERLARLRRQHDMFSAALRQFLAASSQHVVPTAAACAGQPAPGAKPPPLSPPIAPGSPWPAVPWRPPQQAYPPLAIAPAIHQPPQLLVAPAAKQPALPGAPRPPPPYQPRPAHSTAASQLGTPNSR